MKLADIRSRKEFVRHVRTDGHRIGLSTGYAPWFAAFAREHLGVWSHSSRMWVFEDAGLNGKLVSDLLAILPPEWVLDARELGNRVREARATPVPDLFGPHLDVQIFPIQGGGCALLFKLDQVLLRFARELGGSYIGRHGAWRITRSPDALLDALESSAGIARAHVYVHETKIVLAQLSSISEPDRPAVSVGGAMPDFDAAIDSSEGAVITTVVEPLARMPLPPGAELRAVEEFGLAGKYAYQLEGVKHLLSHSSALLADDMGLGKSRQAVIASHLVPGDAPVFVGCPANLRVNWQREIHAVDPAAVVAIVGDGKVWKDADWVIVNYELFGGVVQAISDGIVTFRAMILDEAHYLKEPTSSRTLNAFLLAKHIERRFLLTATPVLNRESELHTLLRLSGHPLGDLALGEFLEQYAGDPEQRRLLSGRIAEWMLRRPKSVLKLHGKSQHPRYIEMGVDEQAQYKKVLNDASLLTLVKLGNLRKLLERVKAVWLVETLLSLEYDDKVIVFCQFVDTVEYVADEIAKMGMRAVTYVGSDSVRKKQRAVDAFVEDVEVKAFVGTCQAAGVGLNLTTANYVCFLTLPWTDAAKRQAEDRAYRNGQTRHVSVLIPIVAGSIDEQISQLLEHKQGVERDVLADDSLRAKETESEAAALLRLAA